MKRELFVLCLGLVIILSGCGPNIKETREEIEKMDVLQTYRLAIKYYSEGLINESEILFNEVLKKYSTLENPTKEERNAYLWSLYEISFIEYSKENYDNSIRYLEKLFSETSEFENRLPQVILGKRLQSKIKEQKR